jgi:hypothetical protein
MRELVLGAAGPRFFVTGTCSSFDRTKYSLNRKRAPPPTAKKRRNGSRQLGTSELHCCRGRWWYFGRGTALGGWFMHDRDEMRAGGRQQSRFGLVHLHKIKPRPHLPRIPSLHPSRGKRKAHLPAFFTSEAKAGSNVETEKMHLSIHRPSLTQVESRLGWEIASSCLLSTRLHVCCRCLVVGAISDLLFK